MSEMVTWLDGVGDDDEAITSVESNEDVYLSIELNSDTKTFDRGVHGKRSCMLLALSRLDMHLRYTQQAY